MARFETHLALELIEAIVPQGAVVVALTEVYIDESGSHDGSPILCVGGYAFRRPKARQFTQEWRKVLRRENLPYFRASACAHRQDPFDRENWSDERCDQLQRKLIAHVHRHAEVGFAVAVNEPEYREVFGDNPPMGAPYSFCLRMVLVGFRHWMRNRPDPGPMTYIFESGHRDAAQADAMMRRVTSSPDTKLDQFYVGHAFLEKSVSVPLQAADLLAWQWHTDAKRKRAGNNVSRKDCMALIRPRDTVMEWGAKNLREMADGIKSGRLVGL